MLMKPTILVMQDCDVPGILMMFSNFALSSGLKGNYHKSCLIPINICHEKVVSLANVFGCMVGSFHFTYLGLPFVLTKLALGQGIPWSGLREGFWQVLNFSPTQVGCSWSTLLFAYVDKYRKNYLLRGSDF